MPMSNEIEILKTKYAYDEATPMLKQYLDIKFANPDCLILFRMGDFYESFFDDAVQAAQALNITLTKRGKHAGKTLPMCGIPFHALENYLPKLVDSNQKIAICEQLETPEEAKKRGYKAVVKRDIVRIVTPGTISEENLLNNKQPNYLIAIAKHKSNYALSYIDITTLEFKVCSIKESEIFDRIASLNPKEIIANEKIQNYSEFSNLISNYRAKIVYQVDSYFDLNKNIKTITEFYQINSTQSLGELNEAMLIAAGNVIEYLKITQRDDCPKIGMPKLVNFDQYLALDNSARTNLELFKTLNGDYKNSLLSCINKCQTSGGSRLLFNYLSNPLKDLDKIHQRLNLVEYMLKHLTITDEIRDHLSNIMDLEKLLVRFSNNKANPRDLINLKHSLLNAENIISYLKTQQNLPEKLGLMINKIDSNAEIINLIEKAISEEASANLADGNFINPDYNPEINELYQLVYNNKNNLENLRDKYRLATGISNLKLSHNNILGMYVEVNQSYASKIDTNFFKHKQTLANSIRYTTTELQDLEQKTNEAKSLAINKELEIFEYICRQVVNLYSNILLLATTMNILDVVTNFAFLADEYNLTKPEIDNSYDFNIEQGKHIIVDNCLKQNNINFVANDCDLKRQQFIWLITGPNMAGKSTFLRQNALIALLGQIGCFVPAKTAKFGVVDKIFSRIGAADNLALNQSTFMVEMIETAMILNQATDRSLVILDEVGRGTSTYDGMSIAWSCLEYLHNKIKCRTLFATHYHELTELEGKFQNIANYTIAINEANNKISFTHKIIKGSASKSYGLHVAALAGLPEQVIARAEQILTEFEAEDDDSALRDRNTQNFDLFSYQDIKNKTDNDQRPKLNDNFQQMNDKLKQVNPDELTPKEALDYLYELKKHAQ